MQVCNAQAALILELDSGAARVLRRRMDPRIARFTDQETGRPASDCPGGFHRLEQGRARSRRETRAIWTRR